MSSSPSSKSPPVDCDPVSCRGRKGGRKKGGETEEEWEKTEIRWSVSRFFPPCVAVLSLRRRLSVAPCVAQWLINMCPSRRITLASESLQTHTATHILDRRNIFLSLSLSSLPPLRFISMASMVRAKLWAYSTFMMWARPIWDSISCLPALSTLKTTTILSWGTSSELITVCSGHGQGRSLLHLFFSVTSFSESRPSLLLCSSFFPIFTCFRFMFFSWQTHLMQLCSEVHEIIDWAQEKVSLLKQLVDWFLTLLEKENYLML